MLFSHTDDDTDPKQRTQTRRYGSLIILIFVIVNSQSSVVVALLSYGAF